MWTRSKIFYQKMFSLNVLQNTIDINRIMLSQSKINSQLNTDCVHILFFFLLKLPLFTKHLKKNIFRIIMDCVHIIFLLFLLIWPLFEQTQRKTIQGAIFAIIQDTFLEFCILNITFLLSEVSFLRKMKKRTENHESN